jgi:hypothetical protein
MDFCESTPRYVPDDSTRILEINPCFRIVGDRRKRLQNLVYIKLDRLAIYTASRVRFVPFNLVYRLEYGLMDCIAVVVPREPDVSEERIASNYRVVCRFAMLISFSVYSLNLKMEAICSSETSGLYCPQ